MLINIKIKNLEIIIILLIIKIFINNYKKDSFSFVLFQKFLTNFFNKIQKILFLLQFYLLLKILNFYKNKKDMKQNYCEYHNFFLKKKKYL